MKRDYTTQSMKTLLTNGREREESKAQYERMNVLDEYCN